MSQSIKVMTYNIHSGIGSDNHPDWQRIAGIVAGEQPDVLGLEEVAVRHGRTPDLDLPKVLADFLKLHVAFGKAIPINEGRGEYGNAALTRAPMEVLQVFPLPVPEEAERRICLIVKVLTPQPYYFVVTHFPYQGEVENDEKIRLACARKITETVQRNHWFPAIWVGDFNTYPGTETVDYIHTQWDVCNDLEPDTPTAYCSHAGWHQIDFICTFPKGAFQVKKFTFIENMLASDHRPVTAELELR